MRSSSRRGATACVALGLIAGCGRDNLFGGRVDEEGSGGYGANEGGGNAAYGGRAANGGNAAYGGRAANGGRNASGGVNGAGAAGGFGSAGGSAFGGDSGDGSGGLAQGGSASGTGGFAAGAGAGGFGTGGSAAGSSGSGGACCMKADAVAAGSYHTCALGVTGRVQCWGHSASGQLGLGDTLTRGDGATEMGVRLPTVDLGTNGTVLRVQAAYYTSCAILGDGALKCWGYNAFGGLGLGDTADRGSQPAQMGDNLAAVPLGADVAAVAIGQVHTCALSGDGRVKCWGYNASGQLGSGTTDNVGDGAGEIQTLPFVDLGDGVTAQAIAAGSSHTCALLSDGGLKCWGSNAYGQLGLGDSSDRGGAPEQMGESLPTIDLGGLAAIAVGAGATHTCALLEDGAVRCWGYSAYGALGLGDVLTRGDAPDQMGENLPAIDLGSEKRAVKLAVGAYFNCALLNDAALKCWGYNGDGGLGLGDTADRGDTASEMGDNLPAVDLGTGRRATSVSVGIAHACALLDNGTVKCWGVNGYGQLGLGDTLARGDTPGELGDLLEPVLVSF